MNKITKRIVFSTTGVAASALVIGGLAGPAMAQDAFGSERVSETTSSQTDVLRGLQGDLGLSDVLGHVGNADIEDNGGDAGNLSDAGNISDTSDIGDVVGDIGVDDIVGNISNDSPVVVAPEIGEVASGNEVNAPVASGNDVPVVSGNDTAVGNNSGNGNSVDTGSIGTEVSDLVDNATSDTLDVDGMVDDITSGIDADLTGILGN